MSVDNGLFAVRPNYKVIMDYKDLSGCTNAVLTALEGLVDYNKAWIALASQHGEGSVPYAICDQLKCKEKASFYMRCGIEISKRYAVFRNSIGDAEKRNGILLCDVIFTDSKQIISSNEYSCATYVQSFTRCALICRDLKKDYEKWYQDLQNGKLTEEAFQKKWEGRLLADKVPDRFHISLKDMTRELLYVLHDNFYGALDFFNGTPVDVLSMTSELFVSAREYVKVTRTSFRIDLANGNIIAVEIDKFERRRVKIANQFPVVKGGMAALVKSRVKHEKAARELDKKKDSATKKLQAEQKKPEGKQKKEKIDEYTSAIDEATRSANTERNHIQHRSEKISQHDAAMQALLALKKEFDSKKYDGKKDPIVAKKKKDFTDSITHDIKAYRGK